MELHHIRIRVPLDQVAAWDAHVAAEFAKLRAPEGFALVVGKDTEEPGLYHFTSVLAERERNFREVRAAGGGELLLHPLLARFNAEIVSRDRGTVQGLATPAWTHPAG
jgi:hypothetical protein